MTKAEFLERLANDDRVGSKKAAGDAVRAVSSPLPNTMMTIGSKPAGTMRTLQGVEPLLLLNHLLLLASHLRLL